MTFDFYEFVFYTRKNNYNKYDLRNKCSNLKFLFSHVYIEKCQNIEKYIFQKGNSKYLCFRANRNKQ